MRRILASAFCATLAFAALPTAAAAQVMRSEPAPSRVIFVPVDKSMSFRLDQVATKIVVAQPETAEVVATTNRSIYVRGVAIGSTNLLVYGPGGRLQQVIDVRVGYDARSIEQDLNVAFPGEGIRVQTMGEGLLLTGNVSTSSVAKRAKEIADKYAPDHATSVMTVRASSEVVLEVRVLEASRSSFQDLGFSGTITDGHSVLSYGSGLIGNTPANGVLSLRSKIGGVSLDVALQALEEKGMVRTLARPNLVALSGEKASFLAGGEFPYPVPQNLGQITIQFRTYGVKLNFTPTVQDNGLIKLQVAPEVSQLDQANSVKINGITVPGLITRRAETTVELKNGDSLAMGGLFQHNYDNTLRQFPVLGDLPIIGTLFRSSRWKRAETELMIIVTPRLVTPQDFAAAKDVNSLGGAEPLAADFLLNGHALDKPTTRDLGAKKKTK
ncbi:MAG: cpaC [Phenylobacterium sp.]|nr:cpaC [Phenylobacterium sp.]